MKHIYLLLIYTLFTTQSLIALATDSSVQALQLRWAQISYQLPSNEREEAFEVLIKEVDELISVYPNNAELRTWRGIIKSSSAGAQGGLGALSLVKEAKRDLERAIAIDSKVLNGAAYTSLGSLYYQVPGWPISFGNDKKAKEYLLRGLDIAPTDIDANYFYADFLYQSGQYTSALSYLEQALQAAPRLGRTLADEGRRAEIQTLLKKTKEKIQ
ncbi:Uncharacterised protein [Zhongshania aliphaticivorans]|uniref:Tetratricopeptide repeat protein n=1 Tax=Zhongshania aliphaticivorans TaxID=1470434 RepID=A0A5S9MYM8_9GAMM|nr:tetratricopeptide repeat protein [Zhongshania aliphaticivorans]CAA0082299.1 Uncharacterised protein [Zhongshania aliphaticivorans]CAA0084320.1 Uncharacterised protein [Zhongshania aliphaticivorans]